MRFLRNLAILISLMLGLTAAPASAYSCTTTSGGYRAIDQANGVSNAQGVRSTVILPPSGAITGLTSSRGPSAADVYLRNGSDFVQLGWRVGTSTGLPYTTTPRVFFGEYYYGQPNNEVLHDGASLAWGSSHGFEIRFGSTSGSYNFYVDGAYVGTTARSHFSTAVPAFNGEVNFACVRMEAKAAQTGAPTRALQYLTFGSSGSVWSYFSDLRVVQPSGNGMFFSTGAGDIATDYGYGGGS